MILTRIIYQIKFSDLAIYDFYLDEDTTGVYSIVDSELGMFKWCQLTKMLFEMNMKSESERLTIDL